MEPTRSAAPKRKRDDVASGNEDEGTGGLGGSNAYSASASRAMSPALSVDGDLRRSASIDDGDLRRSVSIDDADLPASASTQSRQDDKRILAMIKTMDMVLKADMETVSSELQTNGDVPLGCYRYASLLSIPDEVAQSQVSGLMLFGILA
jgi:hypothetical protein